MIFESVTQREREAWLHATRTTAAISGTARRHGASRCARPDGTPVLLAGQVPPHKPNRLSNGQGHHSGRGYPRSRHCHDLGCRHPYLGGQPIGRSARCRYPDVPIDPGNALRDSAIYWPWYVPARLSTAQGCTGPSSKYECCHLHTRTNRTPVAPLFLDQRMEGVGIGQRQTPGPGDDLARLVLLRRARPGTCPDDRPGIFPAYRRYRKMAVPPGAKAWWAAGGRLAIRLPPPAPQVRKHGTIFGLCVRPSRTGCSAVVAWLPVEHRAFSAVDRTARLSPRAAHGTGITRGQPVNSLVLSGAGAPVLSGAGLSCYREYRNASVPAMARLAAGPNLANKKNLTCYWCPASQWKAAWPCIWLIQGAS